MQIETVAEGIEADEQAETRRSLGCEYGQGYFFARPLEPSAWAGLLHSEAIIGVESPAGSDGADSVNPAQTVGQRRRRAAA